jgi:cytoskeletal protein CcmA (bactofilin family)
MAEASVIGQGTVVRGNVRGDGSLEILGRVEGDVAVNGDVLLGEHAAVRGNVSAARITVHGAVQGDLRGSEAVLVERGARVAGDLGAPRIGIANGALVRGNVRTEGEPALAPGRRPHASVGLRPSPFSGSKPAHKPEPRPVVVAPPAPPPPHATARPDDEHEPLAQPAREAERRPPPPVVPALGKGAKAKKKKAREH